MLFKFSHLLAVVAVSMPINVLAQEVVPTKSVEQEVEKTIVNKTNQSQAKLELMAVLKKLEYFSADFSQQVTDEENNVLQQGQGSLVVSKPNLVRWQTNQPDESLIVSDGESLWFFDPFIEQATAYKVDASIANTPILLLSSNDEKLWNKFTISKNSNSQYLIHANDDNARVKTLELNFSKDSGETQLVGFTLLDITGQLSVIKLSNIDTATKPAVELFNFTLPEGAYLDDQR